MIRRLEQPRFDSLGLWIVAPAQRIEEPRLPDGYLARFLELPYELQKLIIRRVPRNIQSRLAAANKQMEALVRPILFAKISLAYPDIGAFRAREEGRRFDAISHAIITNPVLGTYVIKLKWHTPHERTWDVLPLVPNVRDLTVASIRNNSIKRVRPPSFPHLERLDVGGDFPMGALSALILRAPKLKTLLIDSSTYEYDLTTYEKDDATIERLARDCQQSTPPALQCICDLTLRGAGLSMFDALAPLVDLVSEGVCSLTLVHNFRMATSTATAHAELIRFLTSRRWSKLKHLNAYNLPPGLPGRLEELHPGIQIVDAATTAHQEDDMAYQSSEGSVDSS